MSSHSKTAVLCVALLQHWRTVLKAFMMVGSLLLTGVLSGPETTETAVHVLRLPSVRFIC
jgi:hypothetical protein